MARDLSDRNLTNQILQLKTIIFHMSNVQILTFMSKKIEFLFRKKFKHASRAKNSSCAIRREVEGGYGENEVKN